jgi:hypothetical protein
VSISLLIDILIIITKNMLYIFTKSLFGLVEECTYSGQENQLLINQRYLRKLKNFLYDYLIVIVIIIYILLKKLANFNMN